MQKKVTTSSAEQQYDLFLIGKTGSGKSSTGNTILGREAFTVSDSTASVTEKTELAYDKIENDVIVKVIDTPGIVDTRKSKAEWMKEAVKNLSEGFKHCPYGFHALILVLKYGVRYTQEEQDTIAFLKSMFGGNFIKDHCILVFTNGENFDLYARHKEDLTFDEWCEDQTGALSDLIKECENRVVLFRNLTSEKREGTVQRLLSLVEKIGKRYSCEMFDQIKEEREKIIVAAGLHQLKENIEARIDIIIGKLDRVTQDGLSRDLLHTNLSEFRNEAELLMADIEREDAGTNKLQFLKMTIASILYEIDSYDSKNRQTTSELSQNYDSKNRQTTSELSQNYDSKNRQTTSELSQNYDSKNRQTTSELSQNYDSKNRQTTLELSQTKPKRPKSDSQTQPDQSNAQFVVVGHEEPPYFVGQSVTVGYLEHEQPMEQHVKTRYSETCFLTEKMNSHEQLTQQLKNLKKELRKIQREGKSEMSSFKRLVVKLLTKFL